MTTSIAQPRGIFRSTVYVIGALLISGLAWIVFHALAVVDLMGDAKAAKVCVATCVSTRELMKSSWIRGRIAPYKQEEYMNKLNVLAVLSAIALSACGNSGSNESSRAAPDGVNQSKYNNLSNEGKAYVDQQMQAYDKANKK